MRRIIISMIFVLAFVVSVFPADRMHLMELFTRLSCGGCFSASQEAARAGRAFPEDVAVIQYHYDPSIRSDPYYLANPSEVDDRAFHRGASPPSALLNGEALPLDESEATEIILSHLGETTPVEIEITEFSEGTASFTVRCEEALTGEYRRFVILTESNIIYGSYLLSCIFRKFLTPVSGEPVTLSGERDFVYPFTVEDGWREENLRVVVFIEDAETGEVIQAAKEPVHLSPSFWVSTPIRAEFVHPHEAETLSVYIYNHGEETDNFHFSLEPDIPGDWDIAVLEHDEFSFSVSISSADTALVRFVVDIGETKGEGNITVRVSPVRDTTQFYILPFALLNEPEYLIVDDDMGERFEPLYIEPMEELENLFATWDVFWYGALLYPDFRDFDGIVWFCAYDTVASLRSTDMIRLNNFLYEGRKLLLFGSGLGVDVGDDDLFDELAGNFVREDIDATEIIGTDEIPELSGISFPFDNTALGFWDATAPDARVILRYNDPEERPAAVEVENFWFHSILFNFGLEDITDTTAAMTLFRTVLEHIGITEVEDAPSLPENISINIFPNPFNEKLMVELSHPADVDIYNIAGERVAQFDRIEKLIWDAKGNPSGVYIIQAKWRGFSATSEAVLIR